MQRNASTFIKKTPFSAAVAGVIAAAAGIVSTTAGIAAHRVAAATAADQDDKDDDPPAVKTVATEIVAHNKFLLLNNFIPYYCADRQEVQRIAKNFRLPIAGGGIQSASQDSNASSGSVSFM